MTLWCQFHQLTAGTGRWGGIIYATHDDPSCTFLSKQEMSAGWRKDIFNVVSRMFALGLFGMCWLSRSALTKQQTSEAEKENFRRISFLVLARRLSICYLFLGLCASGRERFIWLHFGREGEIFRVAARFRVIFINKVFRTRKKLERRSPVAKSKLISAMSSRKRFAWNDIAFGGGITSYQSCDAVVWWWNSNEMLIENVSFYLKRRGEGNRRYFPRV